MTVFRAILLLTLGLLAACDEPPKPPKPVPTPPRIEPATNPADQSNVATPAAPAIPPPVLAKSTSTASPAAKLQSAPANRPATDKERARPIKPKPLPPAKLDLRLPAELVEHMELNEPLEDLPKTPLLPPLFVEKPVEPGPFQLNGRLITNEQSDDYWDSVEGAELQLEFRH